MSSNLKTNLTEDPPIVLDANYQLNAADRRYIDDQALAAQQHIVDSLIGGVHGTWFYLSSSSTSVGGGDCVCVSPEHPIGGVVVVTKATSSALSSAKGVAGVVLQAAAPGSRVHVALVGTIPPNVTALAALSGSARVNPSTAHVERVDSIGSSDFAVGSIDSFGNLSLSFVNTVAAFARNGHIIKSNATTLPQETNLDFEGDAVLFDDVAGSRTRVILHSTGVVGAISVVQGKAVTQDRSAGLSPATTTFIGQALQHFGIAVTAGNPGDKISVVVQGRVDPTLVNVGAGVQCAVGTNATGDPVRVTDLTCVSGLKILGYCDTSGTIYIAPRIAPTFNIRDYGATGDATADDYAAFTAAVTAAGSRQVYLPDGKYRTSKPIVLSARGVEVFGSGHVDANDEPRCSLFTPDFLGAPAVVIADGRAVDDDLITLVPVAVPLVTDSQFGGHAAKFDATGKFYIRLNDFDGSDLDGMGAFVLDFWIYIVGALVDGNYMTSFGRKGTGDTPTAVLGVTCDSANARVVVVLNIGGSTIFNGGGVGTLSHDAWQRITISYDGAHVRYWQNGVFQASVAATGNLKQGLWECLSLGTISLTWPGDTQEASMPQEVHLGSTQFLNACTGQYAANADLSAPGGKFAVTANTMWLFNWDTNFGMFVTGSSAATRAGPRSQTLPVYLITRTRLYTVDTDVTVRDLNIDNSSIGILTYSNHGRIENVAGIVSRVGIDGGNNSYKAQYVGVQFLGFTEYGIRTSGVSDVEEAVLGGGGGGGKVGLLDGSGVYRNIITSDVAGYAIMNRASGGNASPTYIGVVHDDEDTPAPLAYAFLDDLQSCTIIQGNANLQHTSPSPESIVTIANNAANGTYNFVGFSCSVDGGATTPSVFKFIGSKGAQVHLFGCYQGANPIPWLPNTSTAFPVTNDFAGPHVRWSQGVDGASQDLAASDAARDGAQTTTNATTTIHTYPVAVDGQRVRITVEVLATRTDVGGTESSYFVLRGLYRRSGSSLVAIGTTPEVLVGTPADATHADAAASTWTAVLTTSGASILVQGTAEASKTVKWSVLREVAEVLPS